LQKERDAVIKELGGRDGAQVDAMLTTQKALAQAAQSVADAALARKKEAEVSFNLIDAQVKSHLAERLENFLPQSVASSEISAVKGELLLSKVAMKASLSLSSIDEIYRKIRSKASELIDTTGDQVIGTEKVIISSGLAQNIGTMLHQAKFSRTVIDISTECISLLSAGQWPSLLSYESSIDLGIFAAQTMPSLDTSISEQLLLLKREGGLSPDQSNLNVLDQTLSMTRSKFKEATSADGSLLLPSSWSPPGLAASKLFTNFKFNCLGFAAVLGVIITDDSDKMQNGALILKSLMIKAEKLCNEIPIVSQVMSALSFLDGEAKDAAFALAQSMHDASNDLLSSLENIISTADIQPSCIPDLDSKLIMTSNALMKMHSFLRSQHGVDSQVQSDVLLSPECADPWINVIEVASKAQITNGDSNDLNYFTRSRKLEEELSIAIENDAKLSIANAKIKSLEKNLATRSNEISLQNARLEELETLLSQVDQSSAQKAQERTALPTENMQELKEEIRVLNEAIEVLQSQVDEYEREIRTLKDQKARSNRQYQNSTGKGSSLESVSLASGLGITSPQHSRHEQGGSMLSLESALYRPALHSALSDASVWKSKAISEKLLRLPSLSKNSYKSDLDMINHGRQLSLAHADVRLTKANIGIIRLQESKSSAKSLLFEEKKKTWKAVRKLEALTESTRLTFATAVA
jgi:Chromosome segregation ATPases